MKVTIKGLTDSTITFTKIGFTLRGNHRKLEQFPNSVASNVEISTKEQIDELNSLVSAKLIEVIEEKPVVIQMPSLKVSQTVATIITTTANSQVKTEEIVTNEVQEPVTNTVKEVEVVKTSKISSKSKKIKKISGKADNTNEDASVTVVATPSGPMKTGTFKNTEGAMDNSPVSDESVKAAEDMEAEDAKEDNIVDESNLDQNEKMGNEAVIAMGRNDFKKTAMKRSSIDGQEELKKHDPFIDKEENELKDKAKPAFIEEPKDDVDPEAFIEI
jgi:hypothetical protein